MPRTFVPVAVLILGVGLWGLSGCVELPETGPAVPDYQSGVRILNADPGVSTAAVNLGAFPPGAPDATYDFSRSVNYGAGTAYETLPSGVKKAFVGGDPDTSIISLDSERMATILVAPRVDSTGSHFLRLYDRYTFASPGVRDSAVVRFVNVVVGREDVDIYRIRTTGGDFVAVNNLRFRRESAFLTVPAGQSATFFVSRAASRDSLGTPVTIVGASNKQYTVVVHDSLSRVGTVRVEDN